MEKGTSLKTGISRGLVTCTTKGSPTTRTLYSSVLIFMLMLMLAVGWTNCGVGETKVIFNKMLSLPEAIKLNIMNSMTEDLKPEQAQFEDDRQENSVRKN